MESLDELGQRLTELEREKTKFPQVEDIVVGDLPEEIEACTVSILWTLNISSLVE